MKSEGKKRLGYRILQWKITNRCNYHCEYCYQNHSDEYCSNWKDIVQFLNNIDRNTIPRLYGGEPTLHPHFFDICNNFKRNFGIYSNLSKPLNFWKSLCSNKLLDHIYCSLHFSQIKSLQEFLDKINFISKFKKTYVAVMLENCDYDIKKVYNQIKEILRDNPGYVVLKVIEKENYYNIDLNSYKELLLPWQNFTLNETNTSRLDLCNKNIVLNTKRCICDISKYFISMNINGQILKCPINEKSFINFEDIKDKQICQMENCHIFTYEFCSKKKL